MAKLSTSDVYDIVYNLPFYEWQIPPIASILDDHIDDIREQFNMMIDGDEVSFNTISLTGAAYNAGPEMHKIWILEDALNWFWQEVEDSIRELVLSDSLGQAMAVVFGGGGFWSSLFAIVETGSFGPSNDFTGTTTSHFTGG